jgi:flagellar biosynthetic protein FlhB
MADESFQEKTEAPTPKRRQDAREKGQVPRSQEVGTALLLLAAAGVIQIGGTGLARALAIIFDQSARSISALPVGVEGATAMLRGVGWQVLGALAPVVLGVTGLATAAAAIQARGTLTMTPLKPDWSRVSPQKNLGRIFGVRSIAELTKAVLKLVLIGLVVYLALRRAWPEILSLGQKSPFTLLVVVRQTAVRLFGTAGLAFLAIALADYLFQLWQHEKQLKMSLQEVKQETKESEGDPMMKARRRSQGRALARRQMLSAVPTADVVVTNPTHIAVALRYDPMVAQAPVVVALGQRKVAQRIKALAHEAGVPVIENKPLARALLATARVGLPIPVELYVAVAEVLAFIYRRRGAGATASAGAGGARGGVTSNE